MIILIPSYEPDEKLLDLLKALTGRMPQAALIVVNDGSGPAYEAVFARARDMGATVLGYRHNHGKGQALKTGFSYIAAHHPGQDVVCADSDGQHAPKDILRVADRVRLSKSMVLGEREFHGQVPLRSSVGNTATRLFFALATGTWRRDTQTGLRGYPAHMLGWLQSVRGDRYEYELNLLLDASARGFHVESVRIETIYLKGNESSHFRPVRDSLRIYTPMLKFSLSSLCGFAVDLVIFLTLHSATGSLLLAVIGARVVSGAVNFTINRNLVFDDGRSVPLRTSATRYLLLAAALLGGGYALLLAFTGAGLPDLPAKLLSEATLFLASFAVHKRFLFRHRADGGAAVENSQARLSADTDSAQFHPEVLK